MASLIDERLDRLAAALEDKDIRFATAESCTAGQLAAALGGHAALGSHLERGYIVYSIDAKCDMLGIERADAERCEGVSLDVTVKLASAARRKSRADIAIAITGFCGPQEGKEEVGLVHIAWRGDGRGGERTCHFGDIGRRQVLDAAVAEAVGLLVKIAA
jgi:nicotinamide-nucleotide amidase